MCAALTVLVAATAAGAAEGQTPKREAATMSVVERCKYLPLGVFVGQVSLLDGTIFGANGSSEVGTFRIKCTYLGGDGRGSHNSHTCTFVFTFPNAGSITASGKVGYDSKSTRWLTVTDASGFYEGSSGRVRLSNFAQLSTPFTFYLHR
jgi:hypothetical protein